MKKIVGQVISLTKNLFLKSPDGSKNGMEQFSTGNRNTFQFTAGIVVSWWYKKITYKIVENISFLISTGLTEFAECDHETIQVIIRDSLHELCVDKQIFNRDDVCFGRKDTLFDCKTEKDTRKFGSYILEAILQNIRESISSCVVIYSAPRINGKSFSVDSEKIHILYKNDKNEWKRLSDKGYYVKEWDPVSGNFIDGRSTGFTNKKYDYIFIAELNGTVKGNKFTASLKFRKLFSVIRSMIEYEFMFKVMANPHSVCMQIPHSSNHKKNFVQNIIGDLFPYYGSETIIKEKDIARIQEWYFLEKRLTFEQKNRINKCAHFISKGMNTSDIESYINYFVALDALYGKIGSVSKSIEEAICSLPEGNEWREKITWLFSLRNELVHGGSRYIKEWPKYMRYYRHFSTDPERDIEKLAFYALASAPRELHKSNKI